MEGKLGDYLMSQLPEGKHTTEDFSINVLHTAFPHLLARLVIEQA
jgi:hypothetical protein